MEAYPGQPTVSDFASIYRLSDISKASRLIGVTGFGDREQITVAALNAVFSGLGMAFRCLPLGVGNMKVFRKIMEAAKLAGAVIDPEHQAAILEIEPELHGIAKETQAADVVIHKNDAWHGVHTSGQAWLAALNAVLAKRYLGDNPLKDRFVLIAGMTGAANVIAHQVQRNGGNAIIASSDKKAGQAVAHAVGCRYVAFEALYTTMHDVLIVCDEEKDAKTGKGGIHASYLKPGMTVMDLTAGAKSSSLLREAAGARLRHRRFRWTCSSICWSCKRSTLTGKPVQREVVRTAIPERFLEEE